MAEREVDPRLKKLRDDGCNIYSISRLNTLHQCPYQAYLKYVKHEPDSGGNVWSFLGGRVHDALQNCIDGTGTEEEIKKAILEEFSDLDMAGIEFPKDSNGNDTIKNNWIANMTRFSEEFKTPKGEFETEKLILYPIDDKNYMQGYIDVTKFNKDGTVDIIDWKTSSQFKNGHLVEAGRQLILYGLAKELEGYKVRKLRWVMLKYCVTTWTLKNGKEKQKISEWRKLIKDMKSVIEKSLAELGMDEIDIEVLMQEGLEKNTWSVFPEEIQNKFKTSIYVRDYEFSQENIDETISYIKDTINQYQTRKKWEPCNIDEDSFFCASLCGYGGHTNKCCYWQDYCEKFVAEDKDDEDDIF